MRDYLKMNKTMLKSTYKKHTEACRRKKTIEAIVIITILLFIPLIMAVAPTVEVLTPNGFLDFGRLNLVTNLTWNITVENPEVCWFQYNDGTGLVNTTVTCDPKVGHRRESHDETETACDLVITELGSPRGTTFTIGGDGLDGDFDLTILSWNINLGSSDVNLTIWNTFGTIPDAVPNFTSLVYAERFSKGDLAKGFVNFTLATPVSLKNGTQYFMSLEEVTDSSAVFCYEFPTNDYIHGKEFRGTTPDVEELLFRLYGDTGIGPNTTSFVYSGANNLTFYANDSSDNTGMFFTEWEYKLFQNSESFNTITTEGSSETFSIDVTTGTGLQISSVDLIYNSTINPAMFTFVGNDYEITEEIQIPNVNTNRNLSFFWRIRLNDATEINTSTNNQSVNNFGVDDCSVNTITLFNFTLLDEDSQVKLGGVVENTSIKVDMQLKNTITQQSILNFSQDYDQLNSVAICAESDLAAGKFRTDMVVEYSSTNRFVEFYNLQNFTLTNLTNAQNISLFNLVSNATNSQEFKITYKDSNFNTVPGALIQIQRKYIDEGKFKTVEIPRIGGAGFTVAHLITADVIYNLIVTNEGSVLDSFTNIVANCQNPSLDECEININSLASSVSPEDFSSVGDFSSTLTYDEDTRVITSIYAITSGANAITNLNATLFDGLGNQSICSDTLNAAGGTLSCTVPIAFGNSTVIVKITSGGDLKRTAILALDQDPSEIYGANLVFIGLTLILLIIGMSITDQPMFLGVMLFFGVVLLIVLNIVSSFGWVGTGATILWLVIALVIVMIKGGNR